MSYRRGGKNKKIVRKAKKATWRRKARMSQATASAATVTGSLAQAHRLTRSFRGSQTFKLKQQIRTIRFQGGGDGVGQLTVVDPANCVDYTSIPTAGYGTNKYGFGASILFKQAALVNASRFATMFEAYKVHGVRLRLSCKQNVTTGVANGGANLTMNPTVTYAIDNDDKTVPASETAVLAKRNVARRTFDTNGDLLIDVLPVAQVSAFGGTTLFSYSSEMRPWCDCSDAEVEWYGLKLWFDDVLLDGTGMNFEITCNVEYNMEYKGLADGESTT